MACEIQFKQFVPGTSGQVAIAQASGIGDWISFSGDVTVIANGTTTIAAQAVTRAKQADAAANSLTGRNAGTSGVLSDIAVADTQVVIGNGAGFTAAALSGAINMTNGGVTSFVAEAFQDEAGPFIAGGTQQGIAVTYNDTGNVMDFQVEGLVNAQTGIYTVVAGDRHKIIRYTGSGGVTLSLTAAATLGDGFMVYVRNDASGAITIDPNGAETINEVATVSLEADQGVILFCDGTEWYTVADPTSPSGSLAGLSDTNITSPADASYLIYDTGTGTWRDAVLSGDITSDDLGVITIGNVELTALDITGATAITSLAQTDEVPVFDDGVGNRKITFSNFEDQIFANVSGEVTIAAGGVATVVSFSLSPDNAQIVGTPDSANDAVNKTYVDNAITGISWVNPVASMMLIGNLGEVALEALSPGDGDCYVVSAVDGDGTLTPGPVTGLAVGDVVEFNTGLWVRIQAGVGGFVADGTRMALSTDTALIAPYTDTVDDGKIVDFDGTTLTGVDTSEAVDGNAFLIDGENGFYENTAWVFDGTVPTGVWVQFSGTGQINAGTGLTKSGNTLNLALDELSTSGTFTPSADHVTGLDGGAQSNWLWTTMATAIFGAGFTVTSGVATPDWGEVGDIASSNPGDAAAAGTLDEVARADHTHLRENLVFEAVTAENLATDTALADTLDNTPLAGCPVILFVNGQMMVEGVAWTISGSTITWLGATGCFALASTDTIRVLYWY